MSNLEALLDDEVSDKKITDIVSRESLNKFRKEVRQAFALYRETEGCSCCRDIDGHDAALEKLANLLKIKKYKDGSGYDVKPYLPKEHK